MNVVESTQLTTCYYIYVALVCLEGDNSQKTWAQDIIDKSKLFIMKTAPTAEVKMFNFRRAEAQNWEL